MDMHNRRSALDGMLVLKSQLEQSVRESERLSIELDRSNTIILQEENKVLSKKLDTIEKDQDSWIYREDKLAS